MKNLFTRLMLIVVMCLPMTLGWAQGVTTSSMTGTISDQSGAALPGATIVAVHTPTGTRYGANSNLDGRFTIPNMRVGGPYTVEVTFIGYQTFRQENVTLKLAEPFAFNARLSQGGTELEAVTITATNPRSILNAERTGATTNISSGQLQNLPTVSRSLNDFLRVTPQASPTSTGSIGGGNYRQNNVTIDGSDFNNNFGIGGNLPANGSPISLDAVEEISVNVTPFDVRQSGFIGSAVNAVTRSGTNDVSGSAYYFWRNDNMQGNKVRYDEFTKQPLDEKKYGFRVGGPIIKNKLFFFLNAEKLENTSPGQTNLASTPELPYGGSNTPSNIVRPTVSDLDMFSSYLREQYGYETGAYQNYSFKTDRTTLLARLDWNINDNHRLMVRYNQTEGKSPSFVSTSRSPFSSFSNSRTSNFALPFQNSNYFQETNFYSLAAELNSTFGGKFANTFRATYTHQNDPRSSDSQVFPFVDILQGGNPYTSFGYEPFTFGNLRDVETYSAVDYLTFTSGIHNVTGGFQVDLQSTKNGFQRFATSYYTFASWDDFKNGANPTDFALTYSLLPGYEQAYPRFKFAQYSLFAQDEISVTDNLRVTAGIRAELNSYLNVNEIQTHPLVAALDFNGKKVDTGVLPKNRILLSPRIGFNWDVKGDRTLQVRGGTGIFTGRIPTVWIVAQSGDAGLLQVTQTWSASTGLPFTNMPFNPDPNAYRPVTQPAPGAVIPSTISATDPNFKNPQAWKSSLAIDAKLPWGLVGTLEGIYNKDIRIAYGKNYNLVEPTQMNIPGYADNRPIYPNSNNQKFINPLDSRTGLYSATGTGAFNPIVLSNGKEGYYWSVTAKLDKQFNNGLSASVAYVRSDARVMFDGSGDQLLNTWSGTPIVGEANNPELSYASYVVPSRVVASLSYRKEYLNHLGTTISVFLEGSSQGRYSYTYGTQSSGGVTYDFNRDGQNNDLIYVPKNASEITFTEFNFGTSSNPKVYTAAQQSELFFRYIEQDDYLSSRRGKYAERNGAKLPWRNQIDVRFAQDIFTNVAGKKNSLQFTVDVINFANLLNKNWGVVKTYNNAAILIPTNLPSVTANGTVKPTFRLATDRNQPITSTYRYNNSLASTYYMQLGLRYTFN